VIEWGSDPVQKPARREAIGREAAQEAGHVDALLSYLAGLTGADGLAVVLGEGDAARLHAQHNFRPRKGWQRTVAEGVARAAATARPAASPDLALADGRRAHALCAPLRSRGAPIGGLVALRVDGPWAAADEDSVMRAAGLVALELVEAEELTTAQRAVEEVESRARTHDQIQREIATAADTDAIVERATKRLGELFGADGVSMMLVDRNGELVLHSATGLEEQIVPDSLGRAREEAADWVVEHGEPLHLGGDSHGEPSGGPEGSGESLMAPLRVGDRVLGVVNVKARAGGRRYDQGQLHELATMAQDIAGAIARAESRRVISQELHDGLAQELTAIVLTLESCQRALGQDTEMLQRQLAKATREARGCLVDVRQFMTALRQQEGSALTLPVTLSRLIDDVHRTTGLPVQLETTGRERELPSPIARSVVRIAQEALRNIQQHAQARNVSFSLRYSERELGLSIRDDGVGFAAEAGAPEQRGHYGLAGMRERAEGIGGSFIVESAPGRGTLIEASIPYAPRASHVAPAPPRSTNAQVEKAGRTPARTNLIGRLRQRS